MIALLWIALSVMNTAAGSGDAPDTATPGPVASPATAPSEPAPDPTPSEAAPDAAPSEAAPDAAPSEADSDAASSEPAPDAAAAPASPPVDTDTLWRAMDPQALLDQALEHMDARRFADTDARITLLSETHPSAQVYFQMGRSLELQERYDDALAAFSQAAALDATGDLANDLAFRTALCLTDAGRADEALPVIKRLSRSPDLPEGADLNLSLERGVAELATGHSRRGMRRLDRTLTQLVDTDALSWMRARARYAISSHLLAEAREFPLGGDAKAARNLKKRATRISASEDQIIQIARLGEPEYTLAGLLVLGDAYVHLFDDMTAAPPPRGLDPEQRAHYRSALAQKTAVLQRKAYRYYDEGARQAKAKRWTGRVAEALVARRDALAKEVVEGG